MGTYLIDSPFPIAPHIPVSRDAVMVSFTGLASCGRRFSLLHPAYVQAHHRIICISIKAPPWLGYLILAKKELKFLTNT
jgi:hypothetical protein